MNVLTSNSGNNQWRAEYVALYYEKDSGHELLAQVAAKFQPVLDKILGQGSVNTTTIPPERAQPFTDCVLFNHTFEMKLGNMEAVTLGPSSCQGMSSTLYDFHNRNHIDGDVIDCTSNVQSISVMNSKTVFAEPTGWGVISDIDDTIKITLTNRPFGYLQTTFFDEAQPVSGMPELYAYINQTLTAPTSAKRPEAGPVFFYLSTSPLPLYAFFQSFRDRLYPFGTIMLREAGWRNMDGLPASMADEKEAYKVSRLDKVHTMFPKRSFILIGDSTESDPEVYGEISRWYPGWVRGIFIRRVTGVINVGQSEEELNSKKRFEQAFRGLDPDSWHVFDNPAEMVPMVEALKKEGL